MVELQGNNLNDTFEINERKANKRQEMVSAVLDQSSKVRWYGKKQNKTKN